MSQGLPSCFHLVFIGPVSALANFHHALFFSPQKTAAPHRQAAANDLSVLTATSSHRDKRKLASHEVAGLAPANHRVLKGRRKTSADSFVPRGTNLFLSADTSNFVAG
jgi:hypothetical protein